MWWIIGVLAVCIGGACVAQWREWHVKQGTAGRDVETDYLKDDGQPAIEGRWDTSPGSVMQFREDEPRPVVIQVTHPPRTGRSPMGDIRKMKIRDLPEMFDVVDAEVVPEFTPDRALDPFPELYGPAEMARREMRLRTWVKVHPDEEPPASRLPSRDPVSTAQHIAEIIVGEHTGADETWADTLADIKDGPEGRLLPIGVAAPDIDDFYASLSADDIEAARWSAELAAWDRETERDFRRLDDVLEAERQRVIRALTETWGLGFRDECKAIDIRDAELHQRMIDAELAAIAGADTLVMA
jgi:hypothetical protein